MGAEKKAKSMREVEEKKRKLEYEVEERKKRESMEAEFKKKREEERLKRLEKKREESCHGSFKQSELKNDLNKDEKLRIKLIAQEMKGIKQGKCQNTTRKVENSDNEAS